MEYNKFNKRNGATKFKKAPSRIRRNKNRRKKTISNFVIMSKKKQLAVRHKTEHAIYIYYSEHLMFVLALEYLGHDRNEIKKTRRKGNRMLIYLNQGVDIYGALNYINSNI